VTAGPVSWMHAFVDVPADQTDAARAFWSEVTGWPPGTPWDRHPEFVSLEPPGGASYLHVQTIGGPPRVHLDLRGDLRRDTARLVDLGAVPGSLGDGWQVLSSPAGLPFASARNPTCQHRMNGPAPAVARTEVRTGGRDARGARTSRLCRRLGDLTALTTACVGTFVGRIDELAERDPAGIERWLNDGARAAGDPGVDLRPDRSCRSTLAVAGRQ
jgi:hypothetical protein